MNLLDILGYAGDVLDTPGRLTRTALAGRNPLPALFDPSQGLSGRQLLEHYGLAGENTDQGWIPDAGDIGGFAAETVLDPMNLIGGGFLAKLLGKAGKARAANKGISAANALSYEQRLRGAMPEEIARLTTLVDETGAPRRMYAGTSPDQSGFINSWHSIRDPNALATETDADGVSRIVKTQVDPQEAFLDVRKPIDRNQTLTRQNLKDLFDAAGAHGIRRRHLKTALEQQVENSLVKGNKLTYHDVERALDTYWPESAESIYRVASRGGDAFHSKANDVWPWEWTGVFDSSQIYKPEIAKSIAPLQPIPQTAPLLAALLGYNALARSHSRKKQ